VRAKRSAHRPRAHKRNTVHPQAHLSSRGETQPRRAGVTTLGNRRRKGDKGQTIAHARRTQHASVITGAESSQSNPRRRYRRSRNRVTRHNPAAATHGRFLGCEVPGVLHHRRAIGSKLGAQKVLGTSNTGFMGYGATWRPWNRRMPQRRSLRRTPRRRDLCRRGGQVTPATHHRYTRLASMPRCRRGRLHGLQLGPPQRYGDGLNSAQIEISVAVGDRLPWLWLPAVSSERGGGPAAMAWAAGNTSEPNPDNGGAGRACSCVW